MMSKAKFLSMKILMLPHLDLLPSYDSTGLGGILGGRIWKQSCCSRLLIRKIFQVKCEVT